MVRLHCGPKATNTEKELAVSLVYEAEALVSISVEDCPVGSSYMNYSIKWKEKLRRDSHSLSEWRFGCKWRSDSLPRYL